MKSVLKLSFAIRAQGLEMGNYKNPKYHSTVRGRELVVTD